jgi:hypothetical protein
MMERRALLILLGSAAWLRPRVVAAQHATMPVIGFLHSGSR